MGHHLQYKNCASIRHTLGRGRATAEPALKYEYTNAHTALEFIALQKVFVKCLKTVQAETSKRKVGSQKVLNNRAGVGNPRYLIFSDQRNTDPYCNHATTPLLLLDTPSQ